MYSEYKEKFNIDSTSILILEITHHILVEYFEHTPQYADEIIYQFMEKYKVEDPYIHDKIGWYMATAIQHCIHLKGEHDTLIFWEVENNYTIIPPSVKAYEDKHFWKKEESTETQKNAEYKTSEKWWKLW